MKSQNKNLTLIAGIVLVLLIAIMGAGKAQASNFQGAIKYDDFTTYSTRADFLARVSNSIGGTSSYSNALYNDGVNFQLASIDTGVTYNGHPTMRYDQPAGVGSTPQLYAYFPNGQTVTHFWYRTKIRFSPGWTTTGTIAPPYANAYKILNWAWQPGVNGRGGITITNTNEYQVYFDIIQNNTLITPDNLLSLGNVKNEWTDGQWYDYIIEFNETSPTTAYAKVWMAPDGQTPVLRGTLYGTTNPGVTWPGVAAVNLGENFNQNRVNAQELWYGEWSVYDGSVYSDPYNLNSSTPSTSDTTAPTVSLTTPAASSTLSGSTVTLSASAADNIGVVGVQFKVDGTNYGAEDTVAPYQTTLDTTKLSNGTHTITASARDAAGNIGNAAPITVTVSNTTTTPPPTTSGSCPTSIPTGSFLGCYYTGINFDTFTLSRNDEKVNFDWSANAPEASLPTQYYSVRWQGNYTFTEGSYLFTATTDDGMRVYLDGNLIIDKWVNQPATTYNATANISTGTHLIKVEYFQGSGAAVAKVSWASASVVTPPVTVSPPVSVPPTTGGGSVSPVITPPVTTIGGSTPSAPTGSTFSTGTLVNDGGTIYLIRGGFKIGFTNANAFLSMGYKFSDAINGSTSTIPSSGYNISSASQEHPWGTWILYNQTVYYSTQSGMIGVPSMSVLLSNGGTLARVLPANDADISLIQASNLPVMSAGDARVLQ